jgi:integrase
MSSTATASRSASFPTTLWHDAVAKAGIPGRRIVHDFRRTAARNYRRSGVSEGVVMKILGHKTRSMFERYNIKNEDDLREAAMVVAKPVLGNNGKEPARVASIMPGTKEKSQ